MSNYFWILLLRTLFGKKKYIYIIKNLIRKKKKKNYKLD